MKIDKYYHLYSRKLDVMFEEIPNPERKTGRWHQNDQDKILGEIRCSKCQRALYSIQHYNYCPNCGARMEGEK